MGTVGSVDAERPGSDSDTIRERIEASCRNPTVEPLAAALTERVIGQDTAADPLLCASSEGDPAEVPGRTP